MAPQVQQILASRMTAGNVGHADLVFESPTGGHHSRYTLAQRFAAAVAAAGVPRVTFHELRHSFGTIAARAGVDVRTLQAWLGHTELATTMVYRTTRRSRARRPCSARRSPRPCRHLSRCRNEPQPRRVGGGLVSVWCR
jgi:integrase